MDKIDIPDTGLSLRSGDQPGDASTKPAQIMRLNLVQSTLDELILTLRNDGPARVRLGKHPSLHYAGKSQPFHAYPETHRSEIYHLSTDKESLYFTGVMSHSLEVEKAKKATAATDQALATLEESLKESLSAFERGKDAKKTTIMHHPDEFKGLRGNKYRVPKSKADLERERVLRASSANGSLNASPTLGATRSPMPPTSAPASQTKSNARLEALKMPFIHLLAVRAVSTKFLARQTCSTIEDCTILAQKLGSENRLNREKFDLKDKSYKDLDVWKFPYPNQEDRQQAIENAVSAFDRMRISRTDKIWQMLLPKEERGKGKCLSRLNLSNGPIKKATTSRIQVDGGDDDTGHDTDRTAGSGAATKTNTAPPRSNATPKPRVEKEPAKRPAAKNKPATNSTLTGRVTKKTERKPPAKPDSKIKSAEFVHESDDDDDMPDVTPAPQRKEAPLKRAAPVQKSPTKSQLPPKPIARDSSKAPKSEASTPKLESSQPAKPASKRPPSRLSNSPQKPSPLGSSPLTNSSDVQSRNRSDSTNLSSSSSSSPLIALSRSNKPTTATAASAQKPAVKTNGVAKSTPATNPLKRKAEPERLAQPAARTTGNLEHKRRRAIRSSSGGSTGSASPPMSHELLRQQLRDKSQNFKKFYARYQSLHEVLAAQANPSQADLDRLQKQHKRLQIMKEEIWDEDQRLRDGILS